MVDQGLRRDLSTRLMKQYEATQVELQGEYSTANVQGFHVYYSTASRRRVLLVCLFTPLAPILAMLLIDALPLEPIENGALGSPLVWVRNVVTVIQFGMCICEQFHHHIPMLALTMRRMLVIATVSSVLGTSCAFALAVRFGYPFPFTMLTCTLPWALTIIGMTFGPKWRQIYETDGLLRHILRYQLVANCQITMSVVYPVYNYVYKSLSSYQQTGFVLLLPVIKIISKNWISRSLPNSFDVIPEAVVFNVEIYHALFVSLCMGNTTSSRTVILLMAIDLLQAWLSFRDVLEVVKELKPITDKLRATSPTQSDSPLAVVTIADRIIAAENSKTDALKKQ